jgi:hypothetical protein
MVCILFVFFVLFHVCSASVVCSPGYTCAQDPTASTVWVMKNDGNTNGPSCKGVCEGALGQSSTFYACDDTVSTFLNNASFSRISQLLGFTCTAGGCWNSVAPGTGLQIVSIATAGDVAHPTRKCYFPNETKFRCDTDPGNANCFGERYIAVCPCQSKPLDEACKWDCGNFPLVPKLDMTQDGSCIARINYWRKKACADGW